MASRQRLRIDALEDALRAKGYPAGRVRVSGRGEVYAEAQSTTTGLRPLAILIRHQIPRQALDEVERWIEQLPIREREVHDQT